MGAVIIYKNHIISTGYNIDKENPVQKKYNRLRGFDVDETRNTIHAEIMALNKANGANIIWSKACIFIYRERKDGKIGLARPCKACMEAIKDFGIKNIYYTGKDSYVHERLL